ncbi:hypothetical protein [Pseudoclavibacter sp. 13-3]|uniref:hypothetical protein n=1 Tax=Pseudoclavibacter sp. 13-3 TaxID=2901228 RepID=UPI001E5A2779|nr:hypothetical protein [Pseudoclavibacter sp. 13-3]MCD7102341.1 hypothetical protein [Pseudoclavibacter sp. 13-3]
MGDRERGGTDDEALVWESDRLDASAVVPGSRPTDHEEVPVVEEDRSALAAIDQLPSGVLIGYGAILGVFLVYTISWVTILLKRLATPPQPLLDGVDRVQMLLGLAGPALWVVFAVCFVRGRRWYWQMLWLVLGLVLLAPWPWIITLITASIGGAQ